jgi:hypothetical protein
MFNGNSAFTPRVPGSAEVVIRFKKRELNLVVDSLEHMYRSFPDMRSAAQFKDLANNFKNLKRREQ